MLSKLKAAVPFEVRRRIARFRLGLRRPTSALRMTPDFLIIGTQRGGTSSLFQYLARHPDAVRSIRKEIEYFSTDHAMGWSWYRAHFPLRLRAIAHRLLRRTRLLTFEATPDYIFMPQTAARVAAELPAAKVVVVLRDPVERTHSGFKHMTRYGLEHRTFEEALDAEPEVVDAELPKIAADPDYRALSYRRHAYMQRGNYAGQLKPWLEHFDASQILILESEELFEDEATAYAKVLDFVGLRPWVPAEFRNHSNLAAVPVPSKIDPATRARLEQHFAPLNAELEALLGRSFRWGAAAPKT
jgi:hypothetical protein